MNHNTAEQWLPIPGYQGTYDVSDHGRVYSHRSGRMLQGSKVREGHLRVTLRSAGKRSSHYVHRLVLLAFVGPCPEGMEARHLNGTPADNRLQNLRWGTRNENTADSVGHGTHNMARRERCPQGHPYIPGNLVAAALRNGKRACLACDRARGRIQRRPELRPHFEALANHYFEALG